QRKPPVQRLGLMASSPPTQPWDTIAMDFAGPLPTSTRGNRFVLVIVDQFTKWVELIPTADQLAGTVVQGVYERIICHHGCPVRLLSDNGPQFRSAIVESLCQYFGIQKIFSSAYYPQGDGYAERFMRTLNASLSALSAQDPGEWDRFVPGLQFAYNNAEHEATHYSPFELNTGRVARMPGEGNIPLGPSSSDRERYVRKLRFIVRDAEARARDCVQRFWTRMKERFD